MVEPETLEDREGQWVGRSGWEHGQMRSEEPASVRSLQENLSLVYGAVLGRRSQGWTTRADGFARREEMWGVRGPERCHFLS